MDTPSSQPPLGENQEEPFSVVENIEVGGANPEAARSSLYYVQEDERLPGADVEPWSLAYEAAFESSHAMPPVSSQPPSHSTHPLAPTRPRRRRLPWLVVALVTAVIVLTLGLLGMTVMASAGAPLSTNNAMLTAAHQGPTPQPTVRPQPQLVATPTSLPTMTTTPATLPVDWVPQQLPTGWTNANLSTGDALFAMRTAVAFTDREMSLDFRSVGTRGQHGGTFTAALFILTPAAKLRFAQNDVRVADNALFDSVAQRQLIQVVVNAVPHLTQFQVQGQQQFAWVDVAFQLWQSQLDPQHAGQRIEGKDIDPATNQPRTHHMAVLLVRVAPGTQGANAPMGGTGWLVSNYALDTAGGVLPPIVQPA